MGRGDDWIPLAKRDKISIFRMLAMSAGGFFNSINWTLIFNLSTPIMNKIGIVGTANQCVFLAGIVEVFFIQPIFSAYSDQCTFKWGRRRIYIVGSAAFCVVGMLCVAFADKIGGKIGGNNAKGATTGIFIVFILFWFAGASVYGGPMRAIVSDNCPDSQQVWMSNIYSIVGSATGILTSLLGTFEVYKYIGFADNETFLLVFGIIVGVVSIIVTCAACPEEPLLEKPPDAKNPILELITTIRTIPKPALIADIFFVMNSAMNYEKGCFESDFYGKNIFKGENTLYESDEKKRYQKGMSFFFTVNLANSLICFTYSWFNTFVVNKLGFKLSLFIGSILYTTGLILVMFITQKYVCMLIWICLYGLPGCIAGSVPGAIVSLSVPSSTLGSHLAILNSFNVIGQIFANVVVGLALGNLWHFNPKFMIGSGCVGGVVAVIMSWFVIVPSREIENSENDNDDESSGSDHPNSL